MKPKIGKISTACVCLFMIAVIFTGNVQASQPYYGTYLGGDGYDTGADVALYGSDPHMTGYTGSTDFPTSEDAYDRTLNGTYDAFIASPWNVTSTYPYGTYLGGSDSDLGYGIDVDSNGNTYTTGSTDSDDFPVTEFAAYSSNSGGTDAFVAKLNRTGAQLLYSTYIGGNATDYGIGIAVDSNNNMYITGQTNSTDFPTQNAYDSDLNGTLDAFVVKLNSTGALVYSTYLGGSSRDRGHGIAADSSGNAYVTGWTQSNDFPTQNASDPDFDGLYDAFVTKLSPTGSLVYSTYLGGEYGTYGWDCGDDIAVDSDGCAYITGKTESTDFPITPDPGAYDTSHNGGTWDCFVTKLNADGNGLVYSTFLGGSGWDYGQSIALDSKYVYITGVTRSSNFPTQNPYQGSLNGTEDAFVSKISPKGFGANDLLYSTYLGGNDDDDGCGIAVDSSGHAYVVGMTNSDDFPISPDGQNKSYSNGGGDAFLSRLGT